MKKKQLVMAFVASALAFVSTAISVHVAADTPLYRMYNPGLQVHLYTKDTNEYNILAGRGWKQEGVAWTTSDNQGDTVYRLYNPGLRVHLYTKDTNEYNVLSGRGWNKEGAAYRSYGDTPVYRLYHAGVRKHLYTKDAYEYNTLGRLGWKQEGVAFYGLGTQAQQPTAFTVSMRNVGTDGQAVGNAGTYTMYQHLAPLGYESLSGYHVKSVKLWAVTGSLATGLTKIADVTEFIDSTKSTLTFDQLAAIYPRTNHVQYLFEVVWENNESNLPPSQRTSMEFYGVSVVFKSDDGDGEKTGNYIDGTNYSYWRGGGFYINAQHKGATYEIPEGYVIKHVQLYKADVSLNVIGGREKNDITHLITPKTILTYADLDALYKQTGSQFYHYVVTFTKQ